MNLIVTPIVLTRDRETRAGDLSRSSLIDTKVRGLVLGRIGTSKHGLLPSSFVPQIALDFAVQMEGEKRRGSSQQKRGKKLRMIPLVRKAPIGLWPVEPQGWLNALMQWILFIPGLGELFYFAPKSCSLFREYIDRYRDDQEDLRSVASVNGPALLHFFSLRLQTISLKEIFLFLQNLLNAKWVMVEQVGELKESANEFFSLNGGKPFIKSDLGCYELDAFIEVRPDERAFHYIAYGKVGGIWYQCDDERVLMIRSHFLHIPLSRAALLHYKKVIL